MTITPSQFGNIISSESYGYVPLILPCIEAPAKWCDGESKSYHRHRARAHVYVDNTSGSGEIQFRYRLDGTVAQTWTEEHPDTIDNDWTSSYASANETADHPYEHDAVPNSTSEDKSHRYVFCRIGFRKAIVSGTVNLNGLEFGWPHDEVLDADEPPLELGDRTGAHIFDSYKSASAYHISRCLIGTYQQLLYYSRPRISTVVSDDR